MKQSVKIILILTISIIVLCLFSCIALYVLSEVISPTPKLPSSKGVATMEIDQNIVDYMVREEGNKILYLTKTGSNFSIKEFTYKTEKVEELVTFKSNYNAREINLFKADFYNELGSADSDKSYIILFGEFSDDKKAVYIKDGRVVAEDKVLELDSQTYKESSDDPANKEFCNSIVNYNSVNFDEASFKEKLAIGKKSNGDYIFMQYGDNQYVEITCTEKEADQITDIEPIREDLAVSREDFQYKSGTNSYDAERSLWPNRIGDYEVYLIVVEKPNIDNPTRYNYFQIGKDANAIYSPTGNSISDFYIFDDGIITLENYSQDLKVTKLLGQ